MTKFSQTNKLPSHIFYFMQEVTELDIAWVRWELPAATLDFTAV